MINDKNLEQMAINIVRQEGFNEVENLKLQLTRIYEVLDKDQRICAYNAVQRYAKEIGVVKGGPTSVILRNFELLHEENQNE